MTLYEIQRKMMVRGLVSAAAANGQKIDHEDLDRVAQCIERHPLDCQCPVCMAYVSAESPSAGLLAAMVALDDAAAQPEATMEEDGGEPCQ